MLANAKRRNTLTCSISYAIAIVITVFYASVAFSYYGIPITPEDELGLSSGYFSRRNEYNSNTNSNHTYSSTRKRVNYYAGDVPNIPVKTKKGGRAKSAGAVSAPYRENPHIARINIAKLKAALDDNAVMCWAPPVMEDHIRAFLNLNASPDALRRVCEAQFAAHYTVRQYKDFMARLEAMQGNSAQDVSAQVLAYAQELEQQAETDKQQRAAWAGDSLPKMNDEEIQNETDRLQKYFKENGWDVDPALIKGSLRVIPDHISSSGQRTTFYGCYDTLAAHNRLLQEKGVLADFNEGLARYVLWLKAASTRVPCTRNDSSFAADRLGGGIVRSKSVIVANFMKNIDDNYPMCWAPPTMSEHIRTFLNLNVTPNVLRRLCEVQFITNYNARHYKDFMGRLLEIQAGRHQDASPLVLAYAKELEQKGKQIKQDRAAWAGESYRRSTDQELNEAAQGYQQGFANNNLSVDFSILKASFAAVDSHARSAGQGKTLFNCYDTLVTQNLMLQNAGNTVLPNESVLHFTHWLKTTKVVIPSTEKAFFDPR